VIRGLVFFGALALVLVGCGAGDSASRVAELGKYDDTKPLKVTVAAENNGSTDLEFQSPRGGDAEITLVLPPNAEDGKRYPVAVYAHPYLFSRSFFYREAFDLAERGIAVLLYNSVLTRQDVPRIDLMDPVSSADAFRSLVRHDLVDLERSLDYLEGRDDVDLDRLALVGQEYGGLAVGALAALDDRVDALVLSAVPAEPSKYWAKEFVPQETQESFHETLKDFDPVRLLGSTDADVLIQLPRRDDDWPIREYERLADDSGDSEVKWYEDYGHPMGPEADTDRQEWLARELLDS